MCSPERDRPAGRIGWRRQARVASPPKPEPAAAEKMRQAGVPAPAIAVFERQLEAVRAGTSGLLRDAEREPVRDVLRVSDLPESADGSALAATAVIKLNGGLGTSMGMTRAKSLVEA